MNRDLLSRKIIKQYENIGNMDEGDFKFWDFIKQKILLNEEKERLAQQELTE